MEVSESARRRSGSKQPLALDYRGPDRRTPSLRGIIYGMLHPRRQRIRREEDVDNAFLDFHPRHLLIVAIAILVLSLIDGILTVRLVNAGAQEINPVLAALVHGDSAWFALAKLTFTSLGVIVLVAAAHSRVFGKLRSVTVLYVFLVGYAILVLYGYGLAQLIT